MLEWMINRESYYVFKFVIKAWTISGSSVFVWYEQSVKSICFLFLLTTKVKFLNAAKDFLKYS